MKDNILTQVEALRLFEYRDGKLYWKARSKRGSHVILGSEAGRTHRSGYRHIQLLGKNYLTHRVIFLIHNGYLPVFIDHINGCKTDNRIENLRPATKAENAANTGLRSTNTSGVKGVHFDNTHKKWTAQLQFNYKKVTVGRFMTLEEAAKAIQEARLSHHKEFTHHG